MSAPPDLVEQLPFATDGGLGQRARLGLIVLQTDQTIEHEIGTVLRGEGIALYHARIPNAQAVTPGTLRAMRDELPRAARLLPAEFAFDAIGYGCTSGATLIGESEVDALIRNAHPGARTSNPISACKAALAALAVRRIALLTPYTVEVTDAMRANLTAAGIQVNAVASFNQSDDFTVARIRADSILDAITEVGALDDVDAVFVSCTSLRALSVIEPAETALGKPVLASNQALAWHLMRLAGLAHTPACVGQLFAAPLAEAPA
ncbi:MAG: Asp/Glu racemase [Pseudomonadota bacterium]